MTDVSCRILITLFNDPSVTVQVFAEGARELSKAEALIAIQALIGYIQKICPTTDVEMRKEIEKCVRFMRTNASVFVVDPDEISEGESN